MSTPPAHIPDWLMQMQKDVGEIKSSVNGQGREIGELKTGQKELKDEVKDLGKEVSEAVKETAILEAQVQDHINDTHKHLTLPQKMWRKKAEIGAGGGLGALIVLLIRLLAEGGLQ